MVLDQPHLFLSLKWKLLILSTGVLFIVTGAYTVMALHYHHLHLEALFVQSTEDHHRRLGGLTRQSAMRLQELSSQMTDDERFRRLLNRGQYDAIRTFFLDRVDRSTGSHALESLGIFTNDLKQKVGIGPQIPEAWLVGQAFEQGVSQTAIFCNQHCSLYVTYPVLFGNVTRWVLVLSASLEHVMRDYKMITGTEVALLDIASTGDSGSPVLPWNATVLELSSPDKMMGFFSQIAALYEFPLIKQGIQHHMFDDKRIWIQAMPMLGVMHNTEKFQLVFVDDISDQSARYRDMLKVDVLFGALVWLLLQPLLLLALWRPADRIQRIVNGFPDMMRGFFINDQKQREGLMSLEAGVPQLLEHNAIDTLIQRDLKRKHVFNDESDALVELMQGFMQRTQQAEMQLAQRNALLENQKKDLEKERDFVSCLLDHAHVLILTQNSRGAIKMINRHGVSLIGMDESSILGQSFVGLLNYYEGLPDVRFQLDELAKGIKDRFAHEAEFERYDGKNVHMVWHHTRLFERDEYGFEILTVALDISQRKHAEEYLGWLATHDALTGLINRKRFIEDLERILKSAIRYGHRGALLIFDLDQFKDVNDSSGHHVGDDLLKRVSRVLRKQSRDTDIVARLGGDEFAIILLEADEVQAGETAERMCRHLNRIQIVGDSTSHKVSASIGVTIFPKHGKTVEELQANSNLAMCQAKDAGRNGWKLFQDDDQTWSLVHERVYWNEMVKRVLEENDFPIYYQPIMDLRTKKISHYEALMRIFGNKGEMLSSQKFFLSAEHSGTIQELDLRIMRRVLEQKKALEDCGIQTKLSVNLSGLSFKNPHLLKYVKDLFVDLKVNAEDIIIEITETAAVSDAKGTRIVMDAIKKLGCKFALDDFGVGFSSLYYLKQFPFDFVKIDGSFIRNITEDMDDQVMVKALVEVAQSFGQYTVAEFVETPESLDLLQYLNVDYAQGYHVGRPAPPEEIWPAAHLRNS